MKYMALDTETTGFKPGQICQFAYVIFDEEGNIIKIFNKFYMVDSVDEGASGIHGLTVESLIELSEGKKFVDFADEVITDLISVDKILIHNSPFDIRFMKAELERMDVVFDFDSKSFCTMNHHTNICKLPGKGRGGEAYKWPKLSETLAYYEVSDEFVLEETNRLFNTTKAGFHDARFDVAGVYIIAKKMNYNF